MTTKQQTCVENRDTTVKRLQATKQAESSRAKRKGADPANWGTLNIPDQKMDIDIQQAMLNANEILKASKEYELDNDADEESGTSSAEDDSNKENTPPHARKDRMKENSHRSKSIDAENEQVPAKEVKKASKKGIKNDRLPSVPASEDMEGLIDHVTGRKSKLKSSKKSSKGRDDDKAMHPVNHITKDSALGRVFEHIDKESDSEPSDSDNSLSSNSSVSSSESSLSDLSDNSSLTSDSSSSSQHKSKRGKHHHKSSKRKAACHKQRRLLLKLISPEKYDGVADLQAFHKFMNEGTLYVKQGGLTKDEQVDCLSHYLGGRAYHYYT